jgi:hypothetical protein
VPEAGSLLNNYIECKELGDIPYSQKIRTAMGTSFSVVYGVIFMMRLETQILNDKGFSQYISL